MKTNSCLGMLRVRPWWVALLALLCCAGCEFDAPLSQEPERPVDESLLGTWVAPDGWAKVVRYDAGHYVILYNGGVFRAWHSRVAERDFLTLQTLERGKLQYHFLAVEKSGRQVRVRFMRDDLLKPNLADTAALRAAVERHVHAPELLSEPVPFSRLP